MLTLCSSCKGRGGRKGWGQEGGEARKGVGLGKEEGEREREGSGRGRNSSTSPPHTPHTQTCAQGRKQTCAEHTGSREIAGMLGTG